jgi:hypothetical protein
LDQHLCFVEVSAQLERNGQLRLAVARGLRRHIEHVLDAVDLLFDWRGHRVGDDVWGGARIIGGDYHRRRHHLWILRHRQGEVGNGARDHDDDRQHGGEDRSIDEKAGQGHAT